jgi:uncharacterized protein (TIGR03083 family)
MPTDVTREWIADERRGLADVLDGLEPERWETPSLCDGWTVRCVVAHLVMPFRYSTPRFLVEMAKARGSFNRMADKVARRDASLSTAELARTLRDNAEHPWKPPGGSYEAVLTHDVIHGLDIYRPLGVDRSVAGERMHAVLDTVVGAQSLRHFGTDIDGIELEATDVEWTHGSGATLRGSAADLALFLTGRRVPPTSFTGDAAARVTGEAA